MRKEGGGGTAPHPRTQVLRRAKLTETAMRLAVLGLTADAERITLVAS